MTTYKNDRQRQVANWLKASAVRIALAKQVIREAQAKTLTERKGVRPTDVAAQLLLDRLLRAGITATDDGVVLNYSSMRKAITGFAP